MYGFESWLGIGTKGACYGFCGCLADLSLEGRPAPFLEMLKRVRSVLSVSGPHSGRGDWTADGGPTGV